MHILYRRRLAMTEAVKNETTRETKGAGGFNTNILLIGAIVLGLAGLVAYQLLGCASCYGASWLQ
jgi:hypothetical protein